MRKGRVCTVKVATNARRESVSETPEGYIVRVNAPAREGKANERVMHLLALHLGISRSRIEIASGHTSKLKRVRIHS